MHWGKKQERPAQSHAEGSLHTAINQTIIWFVPWCSNLLLLSQTPSLSWQQAHSGTCLCSCEEDAELSPLHITSSNLCFCSAQGLALPSYLCTRTWELLAPLPVFSWSQHYTTTLSSFAKVHEVPRCRSTAHLPLMVLQKVSRKKNKTTQNFCSWASKRSGRHACFFLCMRICVHWWHLL